MTDLSLVKHATGHAYNLGCRCDLCRAHHTQRMAPAIARNREKRKAERYPGPDGQLVHPAPYGGHGSITAYTSCYCRCVQCRAHMAAYRRAKKEEQAAS